MKILVTGSAGHLGEALVRTIQKTDNEAVGIDLLDSEFTNMVGSIVDRDFVKQCIDGVDAVIHTATLHKPHIATHARQAFIDTNVTGTLNLLEEAADAELRRFVYTSTTSAFGAALVPPESGPAAWITEEVQPVPKNIYGVTKSAAEDLCQLIHRKQDLPCIVLRTSRFFPEEDDSKAMREMFSDDNVKANEYLFRRVDLEDAVNAHLCAVDRAPEIGFERYIVSATSPFEREDLFDLRTGAPSVVRRRVPKYEAVFQRRDFGGLDHGFRKPGGKGRPVETIRGSMAAHLSLQEPNRRDFHQKPAGSKKETHRERCGLDGFGEIIGRNHGIESFGFQGDQPSYSLRQIVSHLFYVVPLTSHTWLSPVYWSLAYEFVFYIIVGLTFASLIRREIEWTILTAAFISVIGFLAQSKLAPR